MRHRSIFFLGGGVKCFYAKVPALKIIMASILTTEIVGGSFSFMKLIHGAKAKTFTGIFNCLKVIFVFQHPYHLSTIPFRKFVDRRLTGNLN